MGMNYYVIFAYGAKVTHLPEEIKDSYLAEDDDLHVPPLDWVFESVAETTEYVIYRDAIYVDKDVDLKLGVHRIDVPTVSRYQIDKLMQWVHENGLEIERPSPIKIVMCR